MPRKFLPLFLLAVFTVALAATGPAAAITIDPGLEAALAAKDGHGRVRSS